MNSFARDVGINVLANLVAGALVYLLGVWVGLWSNVIQLTITSIVVLSASTIWATQFAITRAKGLAPRLAWLVVSTSALLVLLGATLARYVVEWIGGGFDWMVLVVIAVTAATFVVAALRLVLQVRDLRAALAADRRREVTDGWLPDPRAYL